MSKVIEIGSKSLDLSAGLFTQAAASPNPPATQMKELNLSDYKKEFRLNPVLFWGEKNDYPQLLDEVAEQSGVLEAGLQLSGDHMVGQGLFIYQEKVENNEVKMIEVEDTEIMDFLYDIGYEDYYDKGCREYLRWGNVFPIIRLDKSRQIAEIKLFDTPHCRLERPHPENAIIQNLWVSAQWGNSIFDNAPAKYKGIWTQKYKLLKPRRMTDQIIAQPAVFDFAMHIKYHTSGKYYGRVPWHACYKNGWLDISVSVPTMKRRLFKHSMTLNYIINVHEDYWQGKFGDEWATFDQAQKYEKMKEKQLEIERNLIGENNAYKTLFSSFTTDTNGKAVYALDIEVIDNKIKEGTHIPDAQIADAQIVFALLTSPALFGMVTPGSEAGSGSNIREASLAMNARMKPHQEKVNQPFYVIAEMKNWLDKYPGLKIGTRQFIINTLDQKAPAALQTTKSL
jgi:hypothetical protein